MFKIGICDDILAECNQVKNICKSILDKRKFVYEILEYDDGEKILKQNEGFDILFLDIEMVKIGGIDVKNQFEKDKNQSYIVFITSHEEMMSEAFGKNVIGFLRKPITEFQVENVIDKVIELEKIYDVINVNNKNYIVMDICYIEAERSYTKLYFRGNNATITIRKSLADWEKILNKFEFLRIHRTYLVNMYHITRMEEKCDVNGKELPISRKMRKECENKYYIFKSKFARYI